MSVNADVNLCAVGVPNFMCVIRILGDSHIMPDLEDSVAERKPIKVETTNTL
jgi:hypothetical protein